MTADGKEGRVECTCPVLVLAVGSSSREFIRWIVAQCFFYSSLQLSLTFRMAADVGCGGREHMFGRYVTVAWVGLTRTSVYVIC